MMNSYPQCNTIFDALRAAGMEPPDNIEPGRMTRFSTNGKTHDKAGWVYLFNDGQGAAFGDWRSGEEHVWQVSRDTHLNPQERAEFKRKIDEAKKASIQQRDAEYAQAEILANQIWNNSPSAPISHAYLTRKGVSADGLKLSVGQNYKGYIIAPIYGTDGNIQSLQYISHSGKEKYFLSGGKTSGGHFWLSEPNGGELILVEGVATGKSILAATGIPVCCAFSAGNLMAVAKTIKAKYPSARLLVCADNDTETTGNPGVTKADEVVKALGIAMVYPPDGGDFNDLHQMQGLDAVKSIIEGAFNQTKPDGAEHTSEGIYTPPTLTGITLDELNSASLTPACIVEDYLYANLALTVAAGGTGKTTLLIYEAVHIALGRDLYGLRVKKPGATLFITAEDSREMFAARLREVMAAMDLTEYERVQNGVQNFPGPRGKER